MKICLIGNPKNIHFKRWAVSLHEKGINICTYSIIRSDGFAGIPNYRFYYRKLPLFNTSWESYRFLRFLNGIDADIFHMHYLRYSLFMKQLIKTRRFMITPFGSEIFSELFPEQKNVKKVLIENAKLVTASSTFLLNAIAEQGYKVRNKSLIYFGVDRKLFKPLPVQKPPKFRVGFVKHLNSYYGIEELVKAIEILLKKGSDAELHIYGDGPLKQKLSDYIISHKLEQYIFLFGEVDHQSLPEIYNQFNVVVMPSISQEAFGVAAIEAQACGIPVIASDIGGIPEAVANGETGILTEPGNVNQIAEAIETLMNDEALRIKMSNNAVEWSKKFEWEQSVGAMIEAYESLL